MFQTQYPPIAPNTNQLVQLLQPSQLVGRAQLIPGGIQNQLPKAKQPQQILPKPLPPSKFNMIVIKFIGRLFWLIFCFLIF